ncbi:histidine phosphatase family protein [Bifidobacterium aquikefiri]|uniref:histidine phosphatase family protein n=1 Tax=Bifidobacterium aquikefiri TaxID=1653207 RepID=UPI0023F4229E|nr:histidine phosphatase family protein [Bifidobacterium aquikefiri]
MSVENPHPHAHSITLVRHGRTSYNAAQRLQGQIDIPLDSVGQWQVQQTAAALGELYVNPVLEQGRQVVVSSDLGRAMATAHAFADPLGIEIHPDERVRERSFGDWEGLSLSEMRAKWPQDYKLWANYQGGELKHGAEPKDEVGKRGAAAIMDWSSRAGSDTDLFFFSHGAWISQTLQTLLGLNRIHDDFSSLISMRNAHWTHLIPLDMPDGSLRWRMIDYNHGPSIAETEKWEDPHISGR